jgi:uncharacterized protein YbbC (DUF1343 family)
VLGVRARAVRFTPRLAGVCNYGETVVVVIRLVVTDRGAFDPPATAVHILAAVRRAHPR